MYISYYIRFVFYVYLSDQNILFSFLYPTKLIDLVPVVGTKPKS